jgi:hypothetical protein
MNKKDIFFIGFVLALFGGGFYFLLNRIDGKCAGGTETKNGRIATPANNDGTQMTNKPAVPAGSSVTLNDLIAKNTPLACKTASDMAGAPLPNPRHNIFIANGRIKMETIVGDTNDISSNMLILNGYQHIWTTAGDAAGKGFKNNLAALAENAPELSKKAQGFGLNSKMLLVCTPWSPDEKIFALPDDIVFVDTTEQTIKNLQSSAPAPIPAKP